MRIKQVNDQLQISDFSPVQACKIARRLETDGIEFYTAAAGLISDESVRRQFEFLKSEELKHREIFNALLADLDRGDGFEEDDITVFLNSGVFFSLEQAGDLSRVITGPQQALKLGLLAEENSIRFYRACRDHTTDDQTRRQLEIIISEEIKHRDMLTGLIRS